MKKVLMVYHYISHYMISIFNLLCRSMHNNYTIISDNKTNIKIQLADENSSNIEPEQGGLRWKVINNFWFLKYFLFQPEMLKYCLSKEFDTIILLGNMYYISTWIGAILARIRGKKVIFWTHGFIREEKNLQGFIRSCFYKLADELLVYGQRAKDILISKGFSSNRVSLIYNSLDYDRQKSIREDKSKLNDKIDLFKDDLPFFGFIGRITPQKKIHILLEVLAKINSERPRANLLIIGTGEELDTLIQLSKDLNIEDNIFFYGACYDENKIFQRMTLMNVVISHGEVGLTAIKAHTFNDNSKFYHIPSVRIKNFFFHRNLLRDIIQNDFDLYISFCSILDNYFNVLFLLTKKRTLINDKKIVKTFKFRH